MRRAFLLVALALPALASAQSAGQITFQDDTGGTVRWINAFQCDAANAAEITLAWTIQLNSSTPQFPGTGQYQVYASNVSSSGDCTGNPVGPPVTITSAADVTMTGQVHSASEFVTDASLSCTSLTIGTSIYVCVQGTSGTSFGTARGVLTLATTPPGAPTLDSVTSGDEALNVRWTAPASSTTVPAAFDYRVVAQSCTPVDADGTCAAGSTPDSRDPAEHSAGEIQATEHRLTGLVNEVTYAVTVYARSEPGNEGTGSSTKDGTPHHVADFWEYYKALGGKEEGGCASGPAGAFALIGAAALLAARRRRK